MGAVEAREMHDSHEGRAARRMPEETPLPGNGQTHAQSQATAEHAIEGMVGFPVSLRELLEMLIHAEGEARTALSARIWEVIESRERELRRSLTDANTLQLQQIATLHDTMMRVEDDLRREVAWAREMGTQELSAVSAQIQQVREQATDRDAASKEAVAEAKTVASTAVTEAKTVASTAIDKVAATTQGQIEGVEKSFAKDIAHVKADLTHLQEVAGTAWSQHFLVHEAEHTAANKFEQQAASGLAALTEAVRLVERKQENYISRDTLDEFRRGLDQSIGLLKKGDDQTIGRATASTQYSASLLAVILAVVAVAGVATAIISLATR